MTDVGKSLFCRVTATNAAGSASADSNTVGPVTAAMTRDPANKSSVGWSKEKPTVPPTEDDRSDA